MRTVSLVSISTGILAVLAINLAGTPPVPVAADELAHMLSLMHEQAQHWIGLVLGVLADWFASRSPVPVVQTPTLG